MSKRKKGKPTTNSDSDEPEDQFAARLTLGEVFNYVMYEAIHRKDGASYGGDVLFIRYDNTDKQSGYVHDFESDKPLDDGSTYIRFLPAFRDIVRKGAIKLPSEAISYGTSEQLYDEIYNFIGKWLDIEPLHQHFMTAYVMGTWLFDKYNTFPQYMFVANYGSGKSRAVEIMGELCYHPYQITATDSVASLRRTADELQGTLILDEMEVQDKFSAIMERLMNAGYERKGLSTICKQVKHEDGTVTFEQEGFRLYGPKVTARRGEYSDSATSSRCITTRLRRTRRTELKVNLESTPFFEQALELRNKLLQYRFDKYWEPITSTNVQELVQNPYVPRIAQLVEQIVRVVGKTFKKLPELIAYMQEEEVSNRQSSPDGMFALALVEVLNGQPESIREVSTIKFVGKAVIEAPVIERYLQLVKTDKIDGRKRTDIVKKLRLVHGLRTTIDGVRNVRVIGLNMNALEDLCEEYYLDFPEVLVSNQQKMSEKVPPLLGPEQLEQLEPKPAQLTQLTQLPREVPPKTTNILVCPLCGSGMDTQERLDKHLEYCQQQRREVQ